MRILVILLVAGSLTGCERLTSILHEGQNDHDGSTLSLSLASSRPRLGDRIYIANLLKDNFGNQSIIDTHITSRVDQHMGACDIYAFRHTLSDVNGDPNVVDMQPTSYVGGCRGTENFVSADPFGFSTTVNTALVARVCQELVADDAILQVAIGKVLGSAVDITTKATNDVSPPTDAQIEAIYQRFFRIYSETDGELIESLRAVSTAAQALPNAKGKDAWRFVFDTVCSSALWRLL